MFYIHPHAKAGGITTTRPVTEKDHGKFKIQERWPIRPGQIREVNITERSRS